MPRSSAARARLWSVSDETGIEERSASASSLASTCSQLGKRLFDNCHLDGEFVLEGGDHIETAPTPATRGAVVGGVCQTLKLVEHDRRQPRCDPRPDPERTSSRIRPSMAADESIEIRLARRRRSSCLPADCTTTKADGAP